TFTVTTSIFQGEVSILALSNPSDPSAADTAAGFRYAFDCTNDNSLEATNTATPSFACKYSLAGTFTARGVIADKDQGSHPYTAQVTVLNSQQALETLLGQVQTLTNQGVLDAKATKKLLKKLNDARNNLKSERDIKAQKLLSKFILLVKDFVKG